MNDTVYITGHKNPDTDSICSSIAYAEFKNKTGVNAVPIRLGEISKETQFVLDYFGVEPQKLMDTVKTQIADLNFDSVNPISPQTSLKTAWAMIRKNSVKTLPIVDDDGILIGIASQSNITSSYMDIWDSNIIQKSGTTLDNILDTLAAKCIYVSSENSEFKGKVIVAAMQPESIDEVIEDGDIVICGDRTDAQNAILDSNASLMILTGNHEVSEEVADRAKEVNCSIIVTPYDTFTAARLIPQSIPISYVMKKDGILSFKTYDFIDDVREVMLDTRYRSYPVVDESNRVIGNLSRYHLISRNKKKVILVDHNERSQSVNGLEDAEILEIIDHHRIADIQTASAIYFRNEPVGCTGTIVGTRFFENGIRPSKKAAGLLCGAIISDTLFFKSPTSTETDRIMLNRLASIADIDPEKFAKDMFKAGSSLDGKTPEDILNQDFKTFNLEGVKVGVSQVSTTDPESFSPVKNDIVDLMESMCSSEGFGLMVFMVTDILKSGSELISIGEYSDVISSIFDVKLIDHSAYVPGVLSRKKQIIPPLTTAIAKHRN
ncbi:MAG: putative manganese-dependent inorganic diphosphatase [Clostridium sp.]|jgi:manganese-dependent inorganic pyrophosphatase|uniref:putative manganese-dependent inorganic diphosphatase n=1 Tax=Clostridium sp. TaxID=1506 RepID=UPI0025BA0876|nr:putative manganese-dependent inorganic diphosphatase [Clostridium sp.]MCH3964201.1 putative manganese-dependent inorganic diphosphatase [Clostridium sp.]MCI1715382.1 putative manganese-dependent inorganic diphosphatase [Clostridium sp.]MCI1799827.1 putative manganese-dependent inorganic diphosphatase [Clostridium sp.]MCI1813565.1 putative manganese-dependent inorganic diphosphatase [Clostridium sp.]MCI1870645.1 putative manganese-dependent inorganic diphosphatase [Clostridium sp.]